MIGLAQVPETSNPLKASVNPTIRWTIGISRSAPRRSDSTAVRTVMSSSPLIRSTVEPRSTSMAITGSPSRAL